MFNGLRENKKKIPRIEKSVKNEKQTKWHADCYRCFHIFKYLHIFEA